MVCWWEKNVMNVALLFLCDNYIETNVTVF